MATQLPRSQESLNAIRAELAATENTIQELLKDIHEAVNEKIILQREIEETTSQRQKQRARVPAAASSQMSGIQSTHKRERALTDRMEAVSQYILKRQDQVRKLRLKTQELEMREQDLLRKLGSAEQKTQAQEWQAQRLSRFSPEAQAAIKREVARQKQRQQQKDRSPSEHKSQIDRKDKKERWERTERFFNEAFVQPAQRELASSLQKMSTFEREAQMEEDREEKQLEIDQLNRVRRKANLWAQLRGFPKDTNPEQDAIIEEVSHQLEKINEEEEHAQRTFEQRKKQRQRKRQELAKQVGRATKDLDNVKSDQAMPEELYQRGKYLFP